MEKPKDYYQLLGVPRDASLAAIRRAYKRLARKEPDRAEVLARSVAGLLPAIVFAASIPIAYLVSPKAAALSWLSLLVLAPLAPRLAARAA